METILWSEESDAYTNRAIDLLGIDKLALEDQNWIESFNQKIQKFSINPFSFCDIGCAYGSVLNSISKKYKDGCFIGVDPGVNSIEIAKKNSNHKDVKFFVGHSHNLPVEDKSIDVVILRMVLQWIPRSKIIQTIGEVDRILKDNGVIYLQDFFPNRPISSISSHNNEVFIFKDDYSKFFTNFPWYKELEREVSLFKEGEDQQRYVSILRKYPISEVYLEKKGVHEKKL